MRNRRSDLLILLGLFILPLILFWSVTIGGQTLLPVDNLYQFAPWKSAAPQFNAQVPQNQLLSDLILENYAWKHYIIQSIQQRELPLWNPNLFAGAPFLANGQHSAYYPFSVLFYLLPLTAAYGWFTVTQLFLAGAFMYLLCRVLGIGKLGSIFAAITYQLSGFYIVSVVFTMIIAAAAWLPMLLAMIELIIKQHPTFGRPSTWPWVLLGSIGLACQIMAGHIEITYYTLLIMALFALWRLSTDRKRISGLETDARSHYVIAGSSKRSSTKTQRYAIRDSRSAIRHLPSAIRHLLSAIRRPIIALFIMVILGVGLAAIQLLPYIEILPQNFRVGAATFDQVRSYAYPPRHILEMLMPNFFGSPAQHSIFDIFSGQNISLFNDFSVHNPQGIYSTMWGIKNYVEGGAYLGLLPLLLAIFAFVRRKTFSSSLVTRHSSHIWFFALLTLISLAFMFGTPLYAILYYGLPGIDQLHSPFRWVFPFTISIAILAAYGIDALMRDRERDRYSWRSRGPIGWLALKAPISFRSIMAGVAFWIGSIIFAALLLSRLIFPTQSIDLADKLLHSLVLADTAFPNAQLFYSFEWRNLLLFALFLMSSGIVLRVSLCDITIRNFLKFLKPTNRIGHVAVWKPLLLLVIVLDLFAGAIGFNPSVDPKLLDYTPPVVKFLQQDTSLWRFTTFDPHGDKPFNANAAWSYNFQDVRGYDSIILKQYANYMSLIDTQAELQFNRIAPLTTYGGLDSPMLDLLNVKYVITDPATPIESPKYKLVYDAEVKVYENLGVMPRAFTMPSSCAIGVDDQLEGLKQHDPRTAIIINRSSDFSRSSTKVDTTCVVQFASITDYRSNDVTLQVHIDQPSWLVLADTYFTGWQAFEVHPDQSETEIPIVKADGNFRAVSIDAGDHTIHFKYSPWSFKLGLFISFMGWMLVVFTLGIWVWRLAYREEEHAGTTVRRVAKNSIAPMLLNLFNRLIDFAFAALMLRILQPENAGNYYFAVVIVGWFEILMNFGLNTLLTRAVARARSDANKYFSNTSILRLILAGVSIPLVLIVIVIWHSAFTLTNETVIAIILLTLAQIPSSLSTGITSMFYAYEKAEYPAVIGVVTVMLKILFGVPVLILGGGIIGLAAVSLLVNSITFIVLSQMLVRNVVRPHFENDPELRSGMLRESFPLMLNHLLATLFFKIDVPLLQAQQGSTTVGFYSTAYKWIDALNIIPAYSTLALFPVMSRQAVEDKDALMRSTRLGIKLLVMIALPLAVVTTFIAPFLVLLLGGPAYLPHAGIALTIMIWSIPFGWINSIVNYILIALGQQAKLTRAFIVGLLFNITANLILIPHFSYIAAAFITILSELVEGFVFVIYLDKSLGSIRWIGLLWRVFLSAAIMFSAIWLLWPVQVIVALVAGMIVYPIALLVLRAIGPEERSMLARLRGRGETAG
jgi:O-antigen/teichoic acid export membrane protein